MSAVTTTEREIREGSDPADVAGMSMFGHALGLAFAAAAGLFVFSLGGGWALALAAGIGGYAAFSGISSMMSGSVRTTRTDAENDDTANDDGGWFSDFGSLLLQGGLWLAGTVGGAVLGNMIGFPAEGAALLGMAANGFSKFLLGDDFNRTVGFATSLVSGLSLGSTFIPGLDINLAGMVDVFGNAIAEDGITSIFNADTWTNAFGNDNFNIDPSKWSLPTFGLGR